MVDVAKTVTTGKLQDWENTLAPLSKSQRTSLQELDDDATSRPYPAKVRIVLHNFNGNLIRYKISL
jgi:hypothetical protein